MHFLDEYAEPIAYDLLGLGLRLRDLGSDRFSWADLYAVIRQTPPGSALGRSLNPDHVWDLKALLLAEIADALNVANWQRSGQPRRDYPKPIPRPGVEPTTTTYGKGALPYDEMAEWLGWT